jgi:undecaprenyl-diphosphatase
MTGLQALITAILQGLTELFPVSSLGHAVILPRLLHWSVDQYDPRFLPFLVVLHLGTAAALLIYFWRDWARIVLAFFGVGLPKERREQWRLLWLIVVATVPAVIVGFALEKVLRALFGSPAVAAAFLIVNGVILFVAERLRRKEGEGRAVDMSWRTALAIGFWQCLALIPGISRSGATMVGGLLGGLHHREAARFSFLIATPIILGAGVLEVPHLLHRPAEGGGGFGPLIWLAGVVAGLTAYGSTAFLMRYFGRQDFEALDPFAYYCWAVGAASLAVIYFAL